MQGTEGRKLHNKAIRGCSRHRCQWFTLHTHPAQPAALCGSRGRAHRARRRLLVLGHDAVVVGVQPWRCTVQKSGYQHAPTSDAAASAGASQPRARDRSGAPAMAAVSVVTIPMRRSAMQGVQAVC